MWCRAGIVVALAATALFAAGCSSSGNSKHPSSTSGSNKGTATPGGTAAAACLIEGLAATDVLTAGGRDNYYSSLSTLQQAIGSQTRVFFIATHAYAAYQVATSAQGAGHAIRPAIRDVNDSCRYFNNPLLDQAQVQSLEQISSSADATALSTITVHGNGTSSELTVPSTEPQTSVAVTGAPPTDPPTASVPNGDPTVINCSGEPPAARPKLITLACADGGEAMTGVAWTSWGGAAATGTGMLAEQSCKPDCAHGTTAMEKATITLTHIVSGNYTTVTVTPKSPNPASFRTIHQTLPG